MNKLWAFGCSFTKGEGCNIGDEYYEKYKKDGDKLWTELVAEYFNLNLINEGENGASNEIVLDKIIDKFDYINENDLVIIGFTIPQRFDVPYDGRFVSIFNRFIETGKSEIINFYSKNELEAIINFQYYFCNSPLHRERQLKRFNFIINRLKEKGVKTIMWDLLRDTNNLYERIYKATKGEIEDPHFSFFGHYEFAKYIITKIDTLNTKTII